MAFHINYQQGYKGCEEIQELGSDVMQYLLAKYELNNISPYFEREHKRDRLVVPDGTVSMDYHSNGLEIKVFGKNEDLLGEDILNAFPGLKKSS